jgi:hypothetical protein
MYVSSLNSGLEVEVNTDVQLASLPWYWAPIRSPWPDFLPDSCGFLEVSLTRGWICNLLVRLVLGLIKAVTLGFKSHENSWTYFSISFEIPQPGDQVLHSYPPGAVQPSYIPWDWAPFTSPLTSRSAKVEVFYPISSTNFDFEIEKYPVPHRKSNSRPSDL